MKLAVHVRVPALDIECMASQYDEWAPPEPACSEIYIFLAAEIVLPLPVNFGFHGRATQQAIIIVRDSPTTMEQGNIQPLRLSGTYVRLGLGLLSAPSMCH
jgi:hypothetical protein